MRAQGCNPRAIRLEDLNTMIVAVSNIQTFIHTKAKTTGLIELPRFVTETSELTEEHAVVAEHLHSVVGTI